MSTPVLHIVIKIAQQLSRYKFDKGEVVGELLLTPQNLNDLILLSQCNLIDSVTTIDNKSVALERINLQSEVQVIITVTIYTKNLSDGYYYDDIKGFINANLYEFPKRSFYIKNINYLSDDQNPSKELAKVKDVHNIGQLLFSIADVTIEDADNVKQVLIFQKKKLVIPIIFSQNDVRNIDFYEELMQQLTTAHDKEERISIFKTELVNLLFDTPVKERFVKLLNNLNSIYDSYLKSHLLYLEKFSYHDLKSEVDADKLDFTKKIYSTVNDIQTKLIAVPAAFLLVLSQFDFTGQQAMKNFLILVGSVLFSILLEVLLSNQFSVLKYIQKEIIHFKNELSNKETKLDLNEFIRSFGDLDPLIKRQRCFLWIFRVVVWLVTIASLFMFFYFKNEVRI